MNCLSALRGCVLHEVVSGSETLFWRDSWLAGKAPMYVLPEEFRGSNNPNGSVHEQQYLLDQALLNLEGVCSNYRVSLRDSMSTLGDSKRWRLSGNGSFTVKSLYNFLNDGGLRCPIARFFWRKPCLKKVNLFNWMAWKYKILTLDVMSKRSSNMLPTATCVLCNSAIEMVDHLFCQCNVAR